MKHVTLLLCCLLGLFVLHVEARANNHIKLDVTLDLSKRQLHVTGQANMDVRLPNGDNNPADKPFSYNWPLPDPTAPQHWRGGPFADEQNLYLPNGWYPHTNDFYTFDVQITSPVITIIPGQIHNEEITPETYRAHFRMDQPSEGIPLFTGPYEITKYQHGPIEIRTYFYDGMEDLSNDYLERSAQYITRFQAQIGPFPFSQFHIIAAPVGAGYGFAGLTYMSKRILPLPFILESSLGHEILHNYWGNGVFPDYKSGNWAEGLTTYMADYMTQELAAPTKARNMRLDWLRDYNALPADQDKPVTSFISKHGTASQVIGYHKVAFIFHMLRQTMGDHAFFDGLRQFWMNFAFKTASWQDLQDSFQQVTKLDLNDFFKQWLHRTGAPDFTSLSATTSSLGTQKWQINTSLMQNNPVFKTVVPIEIDTGDGSFSAQLNAESRLSSSTVILDKQPHALRLDPDFNILRRLGTNEAPPILRDVMLAREVEVMILPSIADQRETTIKLAQRLTEGHFTTPDRIGQEKPFILIGEISDIKQALHKLRLNMPDLKKQDKTTAYIWVDKLENTIPYMVIALKKGAETKDLLRPLPHYGKYNMLQFNKARMIWKSTGQTQPITVPIR
jgi:hypothetical protein